MYRININSTRPYIDGSLTAKLAASVSAYWWTDDMPTETVTTDPETGEEIKTPYEGQLLATLEIAAPVSEIVATIAGKEPEEAKAALNEYVLSLARVNSVMSLENLAMIKSRLDTEAAALDVCNQAVAALDMLVIYPARIPYTE